jgi:N-acetylglutamate synthase/N-acetylornithine aminotransferase
MQNNTLPNNTIPKNILLNWLYSTDRHVSIDKLGDWLENNTNGQYKLIKIDHDIQTSTNNTIPLNKECA